ncbi:MAG TPA: cytochrome P450 [Myxococcales bacterium]|nr:cytochrome P450 [Myxococcales bacterium]
MEAATAVVPAPRHAPLFKGDGGFLGSAREFQGDPIRTFFKAYDACGDVARIEMPVAPYIVHILNHPDHLRRVLVDNQKAYGKGSRGYQRLRETLGNGLVTSDGDFWKRQRRIANPAFHHERIAHFSETMVRCAEETADGWVELVASGEPVDISREMMRLTLRVIGLTMLSTEVASAASVVGVALDDLLRVTIHRIKDIIVAPLAIPTPGNRRFLRARAALDQVVNGIIAERRRAGEGGKGAGDGAGPGAGKHDLLEMLMAARDPETGEGMTDVQLRDEAMTIFTAGHETTANAMSWTLYLLSLHPGTERLLREEIARVVGDRPPRLEDLPKLVLVDRVIKESMRLFPPVWGLERSVLEDDVVGGFEIPKGSWVFMSPYRIHRDARFWENPEGFDPDRFTPEAEAARHKGAYAPFSLGPRKCIGESFAMLEARLLLTTLLRRARLELVPGKKVVPEPTVTLRPKDGLWMRVRPPAAAV